MAMEDPVTKERFFATPLCVEAVSGKRPAPAEWSYSDDTPANQSSYGKNSKGAGAIFRSRLMIFIRCLSFWNLVLRTLRMERPLVQIE